MVVTLLPDFTINNLYLTLGVLEPGLNARAHTLGEMAEAAYFFLRTPSLTASNFAALWLTDPKFLAIKDMLIFSQYIEFQGAGQSYGF